MRKAGLNQLLVFVAGVAAFFSISSCSLFMGEDGKNGNAFIAYSWVVGPINFYTEDPAFEDDTYIQNGVYRETSPGDYFFEYIAWDDSYWYGTYTIYVNEGTEAQLFEEGVDGEDIYFELSCLSFGPILYTWSEEYAYRSMGEKGFENDKYWERLNSEQEKAGEYSHTRPSGAKVFSPESHPQYEEQQIISAGKYTVVLQYGGGGRSRK